MSPTEKVAVEIGGREVSISNPNKVFFPASGKTKMDLVQYYVTVADALMNTCDDRPTTMYRWPNGVSAPDDAFYQKRVPPKRPDWIETALVHYPSGRSAEMLALTEPASILWAVNLGCIDLNPWPVRLPDVDHPDELRVDLDPTPEIPYTDVQKVAPVVRDVLEEHDLTGFVKTSGKRGMHIYVRIEPRWDFTEVRRAALALAREVERRMPDVATTAWWKEERRGVFVDFNQNARDRTIASVYSVRPVEAGWVSCPVAWDEVADLDPHSFTMDSVTQRLERHGDPWAAMDDRPGSLEPLLELAARDERGGLGDAPWPPHFPKAEGEPRRVQPSKRRHD